jgi:hypothetical protein
MGGGLIQLVANGASDRCLIGNPEVTFFQIVYRRHSNFVMESIEQKYEGVADFGRRASFQIMRYGDMIHRMYVEITLANASWLEGTYRGNALIKSIELEIGGQRIDKHYGDWMYVWNELTLSPGKREGYRSMVGYKATGLDPDWDRPLTTIVGESTTLYIPVEFWFCRNVGLALPLIGIQYHEVFVHVEFDTRQNANIDTERYDQHVSGTTTFAKAALWVDYIYLDSDERRRFAQGSQEYLIEQLQYTDEERIIAGERTKLRMRFKHPVKELMWISQTNSAKFGVYTHEGRNLTVAAELMLNAQNRFAKRPGAYFNVVQPYQHHRNTPANKGINVYSFALDPEEHQPSGTLNFSQIDSAELWVDSMAEAVKIRLYAVNYNVFRIMSGMSGVAFAN